MDEITYLREESKTKSCIIPTSFENYNVIHLAANSKRFNTTTKIQTEPKSRYPFFVLKNISSNIAPPETKHISLFNFFELFSNDFKNIIETIHCLLTEVGNVYIGPSKKYQKQDHQN